MNYSLDTVKGNSNGISETADMNSENQLAVNL